MTTETYAAYAALTGHTPCVICGKPRQGTLWFRRLSEGFVCCLGCLEAYEGKYGRPDEMGYYISTGEYEWKTAYSG